ncbi:MAG: hypothetical protein KF814_00845 [Nitrospiraceae bacterium]|nr:hypothetical protein [Nitrospiraceae bacterium]
MRCLSPTLASLMLTGFAALTLAGCSSSPTASSVKPEREVGVRTGAVRNIAITDGVTPNNLAIHAGDEVRWINQRRTPVRVSFQEPLDHAVSCQRGFGKTMGMGIDNSAVIAPNESAGLCFTRLGTKRYIVATEPSDDHDRMPAASGSVTVE